MANRAPRVADPFRSVFSPRALSYVWRSNRKDQELYWTVSRRVARVPRWGRCMLTCHFPSALLQAYRQFIRNVQVSRPHLWSPAMGPCPEFVTLRCAPQVMEAATNVHFLSRLFSKGDDFMSVEDPQIKGSH